MTTHTSAGHELHWLPESRLGRWAVTLAGLSAGIVNFYFQSKEALLLDTLKAVAEEFDQTVYAALDQAGSSAAEQLRAIVLASLDPIITEPRKVAVWYGFMAEAHARRDYQEICGHRDQRYFARIHALCVDVIAQAPGSGARLLVYEGSC